MCCTSWHINLITLNRNLWALWNANARLDREPNSCLQDKQKQACFLKLCKECSFSHPVCVAAFLLIRPSQEVEQMLPWHPSGPCTPDLPPTADIPRRTPHIPRPPIHTHRPRGLSHTQKREGSRCTSVSSQKQRDSCQLSDGDLWVHLRCFLFVSTLSSLHGSLTRTPLWKTNTNDGNASIWCKLERNCSLDQIIISRYVQGWLTRFKMCSTADPSRLLIYLSARISELLDDMGAFRWQTNIQFKKKKTSLFIHQGK